MGRDKACPKEKVTDLQDPRLRVCRVGARMDLLYMLRHSAARHSALHCSRHALHCSRQRHHQREELQTKPVQHSSCPQIESKHERWENSGAEEALSVARSNHNTTSTMHQPNR